MQIKRTLLAFGLLLGLATSAQAQSTTAATTNGSVSITAGGTFQTVLSALSGSSARRSLTIQNNNTNGDNCWVFLGSASATKGTSILLAQGGSYTRYFPYVPADAIKATCDSTSDTLYVDYQ